MCVYSAYLGGNYKNRKVDLKKKYTGFFLEIGLPLSTKVAKPFQPYPLALRDWGVDKVSPALCGLGIGVKFRARLGRHINLIFATETLC